MRLSIRQLSAPAEVLLVLLLCFVFALAGSVEAVARHFVHLPPRRFQFPNPVLLLALTYELLALAGVIWIGARRGWSLRDFGLKVSWKLTALGILVFTSISLPLKFLASPSGLVDATGNPEPFHGAVALPVIILWTLVNPFFEEVMETGYLITATQRFGMWPAVLASAFFRASLHAVFGLGAMVLILGTGAFFGLIYWKIRQLWPLILAHAFLDFMLLTPLLQLP